MVESSMKSNAALLDLMRRTGYEIIQENGQRKFFSPNRDYWPKPPNGSEVFISMLPRDCYEDELIPIFAEIGRIYEFRLMMDFSGTNRGFAFATYTCVEDANKAIALLNNHQVRKNRFLIVLKSVNNCRLIVVGLPVDCAPDRILNEMAERTRGVVNVTVQWQLNNPTRHGGFAFIEYQSHSAAAIARRKLVPGNIRLFDRVVTVDWAKPEIEQEFIPETKVLFVTNFTRRTSEDFLSQLFRGSRQGSVIKVKKIRNFAFVHFATRELAYEAQKHLHGLKVDGRVIEVSFAKPSKAPSTIPVGGSGSTCGGHDFPIMLPIKHSQ